MVQNLVAVFSLLTGLVGLTLSYAAHRQKVREGRQESALRAEELRRFQRDREQERLLHEREQSAQRQRERHQASLISAHIALLPSSLHDSWVVPKAVIRNGSNQPVRDVRVSFRGEVIGAWTLLGTGEGTAPLPPTQIRDEHSDRLRDLAVEFTDVTGIRWRREGYGVLRRARQGVGDPETSGEWEAGEPPDVERAEQPLGPPSGPLVGGPVGESVGGSPGADAPWPQSPGGSASAGTTGRRRTGFLWPAAVSVSVLLIAGGVWWLLRL
ncbi:hypothetical protein [Streptomyces sp. NBC_00094]|uniref:hypothetical protein n=1 Tax=Streptomyces sp. NBC_00094 TaxID=2903620 RepID=UPI0022543838|nr:hypothetical protein [Streptomyces sp. NBC_00094]MCX5390314.1 hypothetical protein [Streptomyces sp. NBC_00094]